MEISFLSLSPCSTLSQFLNVDSKHAAASPRQPIVSDFINTVTCFWSSQACLRFGSAKPAVRCGVKAAASCRIQRSQVFRHHIYEMVYLAASHMPVSGIWSSAIQGHSLRRSTSKKNLSFVIGDLSFFQILDQILEQILDTHHLAKS